jgi:hypothetical protein
MRRFEEVESSLRNADVRLGEDSRIQKAHE